MHKNNKNSNTEKYFMTDREKSKMQCDSKPREPRKKKQKMSKIGNNNKL